LSNSPENIQKRLDILYDEQRSLLERLQIHQRNLNRLFIQNAAHGIDVPLKLYNEIDQQEAEINVVKRRLVEVDLEISEFTKQTNFTPPSTSEPIQPSIDIGGATYLISTPYPFLRIETSMPTTGKLHSKWIYVGGVEIHTINESPNDIHLTFFMHGHRIAPIIDHQSKKIIIPLNYGIIVPSIILNTQSIVTEDDATPELVMQGTWTIVSPNAPIHSTSVNDWPRGSNDIYHTTHVNYDGGYDLWIVQATEENKVAVWFYEQGWNVAPIINQARLTLSFPKQSQHK
jgi:hypothetical protein